MSDSKLRVRKHAEYIYDSAPVLGMRTGELLFAELRHEIADIVRDTDLDTFYDDLELEEIEEWLENHIVYNNQGIMERLKDDHGVLWEEYYAA